MISTTLMNRIITKSYDMLSAATEKPWLSGRVVKNGSENMNWSIPVDDLFLGDDWYLEKYEIISQAPSNSAIIDVGCHKGDWTNRIKHLVPPHVKYIGVDPIHYHEIDGVIQNYKQCALDNVDQESSMTFHIFDEPGCNSLLPKSEHLVMRNAISTTTVSVKTLESVLLEYIKSDTMVYYLKCDCQGKDIDVVKSLRSFLPYTKYVQVESSFSHKQPFYMNQPSYEDDVVTMLSLGFEPIFYMEYALSPLPEGEILFKNKAL